MALPVRWSEQLPYQTALEAHNLFGWSVFPLDSGKYPPPTGGTHPDGTPTRLSWKRYQMQRAGRDVILAWQERYAPAAWAVITGALSGVVVLDFDGDAGEKLLDRFSLSPHVRTGSGGYHVYFRHTGGSVKTLGGKSVRNLGRRWPGLDIRADGGYAAFCGRNERGPYVWLREPIPDELGLLPPELRHFLDLPVVPEVMAEYARRVPATNARGQLEAYSEREAFGTLKSAYSHGAKALPQAPAGGRPRQVEAPAPSGEPPADDGASMARVPEVDTDAVLDCYAKDEWGDALLFAHLFQGACAYDHTERAWYLWQGHYWKRDDIGRVRHLVSGRLASVYLRASADLNNRLGERARPGHDGDGARARGGGEGAQDEDSRLKQLVRGLAQRAFALRSLSRNKNVLAFASTDARLAVTAERWDTDPWILGTSAGVLDLRTGELRDGRPGDYVRTIVPTGWRGLHERAPRFERFLREIFADRPEDERGELIAFLQRALGYGITGKVGEHVFLLLFGEEGRNGKDTLMGVIHHVLGATVGAVSNDVILSSGRTGAPGAAKPHLCSLQGKRIAWASETDKGARFDVGQVKFLTGGGTIATRQLYGKEYTFEPSHLLLLLTNNKPHADAKDKAFWERVCPVTFRLRFVDSPLAPQERKRERGLAEELEVEASGILAWLVRGCLQWQRQGLRIPQSVLNERGLYREEEDTLQHFIADCCLLAPGAQVQSARLYERYKQWADDNNLRKLSGTAFGLEMKRTYRQHRNSQGTYYLGIGLASLQNHGDGGGAGDM